MNTQELHEELATSLAGQGLTIEYAERTAAELADHHRDLVGELVASGLDDNLAQAKATLRLGDQKTLIKRAVRAYQRRHWCGRWPLLTFLIGPLVLLSLSWVATILLLAGLGSLLKWFEIIQASQTPQVLSIGHYLLQFLFKAWFVFLTPAAVVFFLARRALRAALNWRWTALAASVLALVVGTTTCGFRDTIVTIGGTDAKEVRNAFVIGNPLIDPSTTLSNLVSKIASWYASDLSQLCQLLLPMIVASMVVWRSQQVARRNRTLVSGGC